MVLGLEGGYTRYPCFQCMRDSRAVKLHYVQYKWPARSTLEPGFHNVVSHSLVNLDMILLPSQHIKLGLKKNFVKALDKESQVFVFLEQKFLCVNETILTAGFFDGPHIRELLKNHNFDENMQDIERKVHCIKFSRQSLKSRIRRVINELLNSYQALGARISKKSEYNSLSYPHPPNQACQWFPSIHLN